MDFLPQIYFDSYCFGRTQLQLKRLMEFNYKLVPHLSSNNFGQKVAVHLENWLIEFKFNLHHYFFFDFCFGVHYL